MIDHCFFLIPLNDVVYDHIKYHLISMELNSNPTRDQIVSAQLQMPIWLDKDTGIKYQFIDMGFSFSTPYKGYEAFCFSDYDNIQKEDRWEHNK